MGSWFSALGAGAAEAAPAASTAVEAASSGFSWDKLLGTLDKVGEANQKYGGQGGAIPQFGPPMQGGTQQPPLLDLTQLMLQQRR